MKDRMYQCIYCGENKKTWQTLQVHMKKDHEVFHSVVQVCLALSYVVHYCDFKKINKATKPSSSNDSYQQHNKTFIISTPRPRSIDLRVDE